MAETWSFSHNVIFLWPQLPRASLVTQMVKSLPAMRETQVQSLGQEDPLEKEMVTDSSILAWKIPWMEKPGGLQSMGFQRVRHDWVTNTQTTWGEALRLTQKLQSHLLSSFLSSSTVPFQTPRCLFVPPSLPELIGLGSGRAFLITLPPPPALPSLLSWRSAAAASATGKATNRPGSGWGRHVHFYFKASCEKKNCIANNRNEAFLSW